MKLGYIIGLASRKVKRRGKDYLFKLCEYGFSMCLVKRIKVLTYELYVVCAADLDFVFSFSCILMGFPSFVFAFCSMGMKVNLVLHMLLKCRRYQILGDFSNVFLGKEKLSFYRRKTFLTSYVV